MFLPKDPNMLLSVINTQLRDHYKDIEELAASNCIDLDTILQTLEKAGFHYDRVLNRFLK